MYYARFRFGIICDDSYCLEKFEYIHGCFDNDCIQIVVVNSTMEIGNHGVHTTHCDYQLRGSGFLVHK